MRSAALPGPQLDRLMDARIHGPHHVVPAAEVAPAALPWCGWVSVAALRKAASAEPTAAPASVAALFECLHQQEGASVCVGGVF